MGRSLAEKLVQKTNEQCPKPKKRQPKEREWENGRMREKKEWENRRKEE